MKEELRAVAATVLTTMPFLDHRESVYVAVKGQAVAIQAGPVSEVPPPDVGKLSRRERIILEILNAAEMPMTCPQICYEYERKSTAVASYRYMRKVMAALTARGLVESYGGTAGYRATCYPL